jgi:hypothetical protein
MQNLLLAHWLPCAARCVLRKQLSLSFLHAVPPPPLLLLLLTLLLLLLQVSYSDQGLFIAISAVCATPSANGSVPVAVQSALHVFPKEVLYSAPPTSSDGIKVWRATYLPSSAWYHSLPGRDQQLEYDGQPLLGMDASNEFDVAIKPAMPQTVEDAADPVFVIGKVMCWPWGDGGLGGGWSRRAGGGRYLAALASAAPFPPLNIRCSAGLCNRKEGKTTCAGLFGF